MPEHAHTLPLSGKKGVFLRSIAVLSDLCGVVASLMILTSVIITCQMIWVRFVLNGSTIWQTEAVIYLMIAATLMGLPYVQKRRGHVSVNLIPQLLTAKLRRALEIFTLLLTAAVVAIILYYAVELWILTWSRDWKSDTVWGVRLWIPYLALPLGFFLFLLQLIADLLVLFVDSDNAFISQGR